MIYSSLNAPARSRNFVVAAALTLLVLMAVTSSAMAANITGGSTGPYTLTAGSGETNSLSVTKYNSSQVKITASSGGLTESATGCSISGGGVICFTNSSGSGFTWNLGDQNDSITFASDVTRLNNTINGADGDDTINGAVNRDVIQGGYGSDAITCNGGIDEVSYADHAEGVTVHPDGVADDGALEVEMDNTASDCEDLRAGQGGSYLQASDAQAGVLWGSGESDVLIASVGNTSTNCSPGSTSAMWGWSGDDVMVGKTGANYFNTYLGNDTAHGGDGCDYMYDEGGSDVLIGNAGNDHIEEGYVSNGDSEYNVLIGGPGSDNVFGKNKDDLVIAYDGETDNYGCNSGVDELLSDPGDHVGNWDPTGACERTTAISPAP